MRDIKGEIRKMKLVGIFLIGISALVFSRERIKRREGRLMLLEEMLGFIECMRIEIGCYLRPISKISESYFSEPLLKIGFFDSVKKDGLYRAYLDSEIHLLPTEQEKKLLRHFFSTVGKGYIQDELKLIETTADELSELLKAERAAMPKERKITLTLSGALSFAVIILLI